MTSSRTTTSIYIAARIRVKLERTVTQVYPLTIYLCSHGHVPTCRIWSCTLGEGPEFKYVLEPQLRIWLFAKGHSAEIGYALQAIAQNIIMQFGLLRRIIDQSAEAQELL
jgi:hypothetical protein